MLQFGVASVSSLVILRGIELFTAFFFEEPFGAAFFPILRDYSAPTLSDLILSNVLFEFSCCIYLRLNRIHLCLICWKRVSVFGFLFIAPQMEQWRKAWRMYRVYMIQCEKGGASVYGGTIHANYYLLQESTSVFSDIQADNSRNKHKND